MAGTRHKIVLTIIIGLLQLSSMRAQTFVELNCENLFDCNHDEGKRDSEFLPDGQRRWTRTKYWKKLNLIAQTILSCENDIPEMVALVEVENDSVIHDLTRRSLLRNAHYDYLITESPDVRGLDVALLYLRKKFQPICYDYIRVPTAENMRPTRDILYIKGKEPSGDTLHVFVVHSPSRYGGELETRPYRMRVINQIKPYLKQIGEGQVLIAGDFNDYEKNVPLKELELMGMTNVTKNAKGRFGEAKGTYRFRGEWHSLDHVFLSTRLCERLDSVFINDASFLLEDEEDYGGKKPYRTFNGAHYNGGGSDHLPLVVRLRNKEQREDGR